MWESQKKKRKKKTKQNKTHQVMNFIFSFFESKTVNSVWVWGVTTQPAHIPAVYVCMSAEVGHESSHSLCTHCTRTRTPQSCVVHRTSDEWKLGVRRSILLLQIAYIRKQLTENSTESSRTLNRIEHRTGQREQ